MPGARWLATAAALLFVTGGASAGLRPLVVAQLSPRQVMPLLPAATLVSKRAQWPVAMKAGLTNYAKDLATTLGVTVDDVDLVDSKGAEATSLSSLTALLDAKDAPTPDVVIVADGIDVTAAIERFVQQRYGSEVPVLALLNSPSAANVARSTVVVAPTPATVGVAAHRAMLASAWGSYSLLYTPDSEGTAFTAAVDKARNTLRDAGLRPAREVFRQRLSRMSAADRDEADVEAIKKLAENGAIGVLVLGGAGTASRVLHAHAVATSKYGTTVKAVNNLFFIFGPAAGVDFPLVPQTMKQNHAVLAPQFTLRANFRRDLLAQAVAVGDDFACLLSYVCDGLRVFAVARAASSSAVGVGLANQMLAAKVQDPFSGGVGGFLEFDAATRSRKDPKFTLIRRAPHLAGRSTILADVSATGVELNQQAPLGSNIPTSPLRIVSVCLLAPRTCSDTAALNSAIFALIDASSPTQLDPHAPRLPSGITVVPRAISTQESGIDAMAVLGMDPSCDVLVGPARSALTVALNPIVTTFGIATVDFGSTTAAFANNVTYPYYSRTVPSDAQSVLAVASLCHKFSWHVLTVLTTQDDYGDGVVDRMLGALGQLTYRVEEPQFLPPSTGNASMVRLLTRVQKLMTRIVYVALPVTDSQMKVFFDTVVNMGMHISHVFILSDSVCQFASRNPGNRERLIGSICLSPQFNAAAYKVLYDRMAVADSADATKVLDSAGFDVKNCDLATPSQYGPFAHDAALVSVQAMADLIKANGGSLTRRLPGAAEEQRIFTGPDMTAAIRKVEFRGASSVVQFDVNGDRKSGEFVLDAQQRSGVTQFASWTKEQGFHELAMVAPLVWANNSTDVPSWTVLKTKDIIQQAAKENPAVIAISVVGLLGTIAVIVFCANYYRLHRKLAGINAATVTADAQNVEMERPVEPMADVALTEAPKADEPPVTYA